MKSIVCSLRSNLRRMASAKGRERVVAPFDFATSILMSTTVKEGRLLASTRFVSRKREYLPANAFAWLSNDGVAEPRRQWAPQRLALMTATSRPWYRGLSSCL